MSVSLTRANPNKEWQTHLADSNPGVLGLFGVGSVSVASLKGASKEKFKASWESRVKDLQKFVPSLEVDTFKAKADELFAKIVEKTFAKAVEDPFVSPGETTKSDAHQLLSKAESSAKENLAELEKTYARSTADWTKTVDESFEPIATHRYDTEKEQDIPITQSERAFDKASEQLQSFFEVKLNELLEVTPQKNRQELKETAKRELAVLKKDLADRKQNAIDKATPDKDVESGQVFSADFRKAVLEVHREALRTILSLNKEYAGPNQLPQLVSHKDTSGKSVYSLVRPAPQLENLVLAGGGAKGVGNPPALVELQKAGAFTGLKNVVGTSAGALTAACLASGVTPADLNRKMGTEIKMDDFKGKVDHFGEIYPDFKTLESSSKTWSEYADRMAKKGFLTVLAGGSDNSAQKAVQVLDKLTAQGVADYLNHNNIDYKNLIDTGKLTQNEADRLQVLKSFKESDLTSDRSGKMITFRDLALLHKVAPDRFKELTLTGWKTGNGADSISYFNQDNNPDMPVAYAGRISMSIPMYFQTAEYNDATYQDGGVKSNMPSEAVSGNKGESREETRAKTMLMTFDDGGAAYASMYSIQPQGVVGRAKDAILNGITVNMSSWITGNKNYGATIASDNRKTNEAGPNTHVVFHDGISTFDLNASEEKQAWAKQAATIRTLEQIEARSNQAYAVSLTDPEDALLRLSNQERQAVINAGPPQREKFASPDKFKDADTLYQLCLNGKTRQTLEFERAPFYGSLSS